MRNIYYLCLKQCIPLLLTHLATGYINLISNSSTTFQLCISCSKQLHLAFDSMEAFNCGHFNNILACRTQSWTHTDTNTNTHSHSHNPHTHSHSCSGLRFVLFNCNCLIKVKSKLLAKSYISPDQSSIYWLYIK